VHRTGALSREPSSGVLLSSAAERAEPPLGFIEKDDLHGERDTA
jgi:hypothetical protein